MANGVKRVELRNIATRDRKIVEQVLLSRKRLVVKDENGNTIELAFESRDAWGTPLYSNAEFTSTGRKYRPMGCYIVEDSQDFINAMRAAA